MAFGLQTRQLINPGSQSSVLGQSGISGLNRLAQEQMQANYLESMQQRQEVQIDAQAQLQKQAAEYALKRTAVEHGLTEQLKQNEFERQLQGMQAEAKAKAQQFDYEYSSQQRHEIAKLQNGLRQIMESNAFSPAEKVEAQKAIIQKMAGLQPMAIPSRGPKLPDWVDPVGISTHPQTGLLGTIEVRNGSQSFRALPKELQPGYMELHTKMESAKLDAKNREKMESEFAKYLREPVINADGSERMPTKDEMATRAANFRSSVLHAKSIVDMSERNGDPNSKQSQQHPVRSVKRKSGIAKSRPFGKMDDLEQEVVANELPRINSKEDLKKRGLKTGDRFIGPDGQVWSMK